MEPFQTITSRAILLAVNNIDTDQIIPARFLKTTEKQGLGVNLFSDWRYQPDGSPVPGFALNLPENQGAQILFAGDNFGCGSSREHAPWALTAWGIRVVISTSFADIFRNNALKNGLLPVILSPEAHAELHDRLIEVPSQVLTVDLAAQEVRLPGFTAAFPIDPFSKTCLLQGVDELGYLLRHTSEIETYERELEK
ncbi:MAG TPA: 3-isopropylmalate dehydratase small subunit [Anaerolineaceae bacterium]